MSEVARWSYANTATVRPFVRIDMMSGVTTYGEEYEIACTWIAEARQERDMEGAEFTSKHTVFTEDARPRYLDQIRLAGAEAWEEIRSKLQWDMSMFQDTPDYKLVTG